MTVGFMLEPTPSVSPPGGRPAKKLKRGVAAAVEKCFFWHTQVIHVMILLQQIWLIWFIDPLRFIGFSWCIGVACGRGIRPCWDSCLILATRLADTELCAAAKCRNQTRFLWFHPWLISFATSQAKVNLLGFCWNFLFKPFNIVQL